MLWSFIRSELGRAGFGDILTTALVAVFLFALFAVPSDPLDKFRRWPPGSM